jgi:hypothetical protein
MYRHCFQLDLQQEKIEIMYGGRQRRINVHRSCPASALVLIKVSLLAKSSAASSAARQTYFTQFAQVNSYRGLY